jgi:hypothetical protein
VRSLDPNDPLTHHASILHCDRTRLFSRILDHLASLIDFEDGVLRLCEQDDGGVVGDRVELGDGAAERTLLCELAVVTTRRASNTYRTAPMSTNMTSIRLPIPMDPI